MYETYKLYTIGLVTFTLTGIVYFAIAIIYYKVKTKELKKMATSLTDDMLDRLYNVEKRLGNVEVSIARLSTTVKIWGIIALFLFSLLGSYIVTTQSSKPSSTQHLKKQDSDVSSINNNIDWSISHIQEHPGYIITPLQ